MIYLALFVFVCVFLVGIFMVYKISQKHEIPLVISLSHGGAAVLGLLVLYSIVSNDGGIAPTISLVAYVAAALGGCAIFFLGRVFKKPIPGLMVTAHALTAVVGCSAISWAAYTAFV